MSKLILLAAFLLAGCGEIYRCVDGKLYERIGSTDAWVIKNHECKEMK